MPIWRLIPIDPLDPNWAASSHRAPAVVRAPDERLARKTAAEAFAVQVRFMPGQGIRVPPWRRKQSVRAERVRESPYPDEGPAEVLEPSFDLDLTKGRGRET
jgi:hypothetical protein